MGRRQVKTAGSALARTVKPVAAFDGVENIVAGLRTDRDKMSYSVYGFPRVLARHELENMYRGSWLAKKIVNAVADDMTREWRHFVFDDEGDSSNKNQFAIEQAEKQLGIKSKVNEALRWARLYGGALIIIGTQDKNLDKPLEVDSVAKDGLRYLQVVDRWRVSPDSSVVTDLEDPQFGLPEFYILAESTVRVHYSRVLRFNGEKLPYFAWQQNARWDDSSLQHVLDSLTHCETATAAVATMMFEANVDVIKTKGLTQQMSAKNGFSNITARYQTAALMKSMNRVLLLDAEEEYEKKSNSFTNLNAVMQQFMVDVAGAADIPMTRLFGESAAGLNATGDNDVRNYYDMLSAKQEAELRAQLERLDEVLVRSALGTMPKDFRFDFNTLWQVSETEQAAIEKTRADRDQIYLSAGVITEGLAAKELKERGTYRNMTDKDVKLAEELAQSMETQQGVALPGQQTPTGAEADAAKNTPN